MKNFVPNNRSELVDAARGVRILDWLIEDVQLINVFTGEIYRADVGIYDGFIAHIDEKTDDTPAKMKAQNVYDGKGMYLSPGFIDVHYHIESSLMTPVNFTKIVLPLGTTTVITDPHEVANVKGIRGVKYMLDSSEHLPMRQFILAPSCVPSVPGIETAGASFKAKEISELFSYDRVLGIAEVMNYIGVINNDQRMRDILDLADTYGNYVQGHAPRVSKKDLSAYLCAGVKSDHEIYFSEEAHEKLRSGMYVNARESSIAQNLEECLRATKHFDRFPTNLTFCTDDVEPGDLIHLGHINYLLKKAVEISDISPVDAIRCVTINSANEIGLKNIGAVAPGYVADLVLLPDLKNFKPEAVFCKGDLVAKNQQLIKELAQESFDIESENTVIVKELTVADLTLQVDANSETVILNSISYLSAEKSLSKFEAIELSINHGRISIPEDQDINYVAVINRHNTGDGIAIGVVKNFGLTRGAVGSTVSHDANNLVIVYKDPRDALKIIEELRKSRGGIIVVENEQLLAIMPLPIMGLLSHKSCAEMARLSEEVKKALSLLGMTGRRNPLLRIASVSLPVIPEAKLTDLGLVSVLDQKLVNIIIGYK